MAINGILFGEDLAIFGNLKSGNFLHKIYTRTIVTLTTFSIALKVEDFPSLLWNSSSYLWKETWCVCALEPRSVDTTAGT